MSASGPRILLVIHGPDTRATFKGKRLTLVVSGDSIATGFAVWEKRDEGRTLSEAQEIDH